LVFFQTSAYTTNSSNSATRVRASTDVSQKDYVDHAQYATYPSGNNVEAAWNNVEGLSLSHYYFGIRANSTFLGSNANAGKIAEGWVPLPLRAWFWIPLVVFMVLTAIGLEMALAYSNKVDGRVIPIKLGIFCIAGG
jgi:hypothetical protein